MAGGTGVTVGPDGKISGASVNASGYGDTVTDLTKTIKNGQVGVTTAGYVRKAGGDVVPSPNLNNPHHATVQGIDAQTASDLMNVIKNPNK